MSEPKVTILSPCYNVAEYLPQGLDSILNQSYSNLQIVMIDDGSSDNTWDVMNDFAAKDKRIEVYHQKNQGVAYTRNRLLEKIEGDFVLFVDSDDWIEPNMIEFLVEEILKHDADLITCSMVVNDSVVNENFYEETCDRKELIKKFLFHKELKGSLWNKLVKSSLLHNISFDDSISYGEDAMFCWHFFQRVDQAVLTDRQLYHYRMNPESISHQTFGAKKLTGYKVWETITSETSRLWPEFIDIAKARWGMECMYLIRLAGQSHYRYDSSIKLLQDKVRELLPFMKSKGLLYGKEFFNAFMMCHIYSYALLYPSLNKLKGVLR